MAGDTQTHKQSERRTVVASQLPLQHLQLLVNLGQGETHCPAATVAVVTGRGIRLEGQRFPLVGRGEGEGGRRMEGGEGEAWSRS